MYRTHIPLLASVCLLLSCSSNPARDAPTEEQQASTPDESRLEAQDRRNERAAAIEPPRLREEILERGSGSFLGQPATGQAARTTDGDVELRFDAVNIEEFISVVLGDILGLNYAIDPEISGTVTIHTTTPIREEEILPLFEDLLAVNGAALVRSAGIYRVIPLASAANSQVVSVADGAYEPGFSTQIIPLQFIAATEMQDLIGKVIPDPETIRIDSTRNVVIASGTASELAAVRDVISIFDVDWLRGMSVGLYPLDYVEPGTLEGELIEVLNATAGGDPEALLGGVVRLVPIERLSSLLVVSSTTSALREVEIWIRRLDQPGESDERRLFVYPMENAKASELAEILGQIFQSRGATSAGGSGSASTLTTRSSTGQLAPGLTATRLGAEDSRAPAGGQASGFGGGSGSDGDSGGDFALTGSESIEIIADDVRNSLVILASPREYQMVEAALQKLDIVPLQVMIEARILEVTLRDDLSFGVEWFFRNSLTDDGQPGTGTGTLDVGSPGIAALAPGFSYTVVNSATQVRLALNALASESEVNVLSSPSLMVLDNQTATINVGDEIPVPTRQSISNVDPSSPTVNEITFRQTGVTLSVTPRVSNSGLVTMEILQEVATATSTTTSNIDAPTIQNRQIESVVAINSGETIVLGGLMHDQDSSGSTGIPGLYRIPVLGRLFGRKVSEYSRTELLVLITPRVVRNQNDAREVTEELRRNLPQLRALGSPPADESSTPSI